MTRHMNILIIGLMAISAMTAAVGHAEDKAAVVSPPPPSEEEIAESLKKLIFVPHDTGAPVVTDTGGVRSVTVRPKIELLAPQQLARTLSPTPTLYWHISNAAEAPLHFMLRVDEAAAIDPLLEIKIGGIKKDGIYGIRLSDYGISLENRKSYVWSIALAAESDGSARDLIAQTLMEHRAAPDLAEALDAAQPEDRAIRLAAEGYWYDALDVLSHQIKNSAEAPWKAARARLLDQAGLQQAARFDRQPAAY